MDLKVGDRVRDRFKLPKAGDECVTGTVSHIDTNGFQVTWDDGRRSTLSNAGEATLEKLEG